MQHFDYMIVGAGAAGCVLANRLSADPNIKVALVEQGPDKNARKSIIKMPLAMVTFMAPALAFLGGPKFMSWFETEPEPGLQGRRIALPRGIGTGGSTNVNGQCYNRGQREDFDAWRDVGCEGWGYDDLLPYFKKLENYESTFNIDQAYHGKNGPLNIAPPRHVNALSKLFIEAACSAGHRRNFDFNGERQDGVGYYAFTQKNGERVTAESAYIDPIRHRPNLTILSNQKITRLDMEGTKVIGASGIRAKEVILSAGAFVSPQMLMLSGIGNRKELEKHGIKVAHHLPDVGENLSDHLDVTLEFKAKTTAPYGISWAALPANILHVFKWLFQRRGLFATTTGEAGAFLSTDPKTTRPDIQLFFCAAKGNTQSASGFTGHAFLVHICQLRPGSIGKLSLRSGNVEDKPSIIYNFFRSGTGEDVIRKGIRMARHIIAQKQFAAHLDHEASPGADVESDGAIDAFIRQTVGTLFHPVGTCSMGKVVDPTTLRVYGIEGLRVVDASIMPTVPSANTVAATYCLAEKAADLILHNPSPAPLREAGEGKSKTSLPPFPFFSYATTS
jgi:choline dehydrogenase